MSFPKFRQTRQWFNGKIHRCQQPARMSRLLSTFDGPRVRFSADASSFLLFTSRAQSQDEVVQVFLGRLRKGTKFRSWTRILFYPSLPKMLRSLKVLSLGGAPKINKNVPPHKIDGSLQATLDSG
jgi:hypothetical protein